ncbi:hypothetical protein ACOSQ3_029256 [Xanthoceras sorbifolium]
MDIGVDSTLLACRPHPSWMFFLPLFFICSLFFFDLIPNSFLILFCLGFEGRLGMDFDKISRQCEKLSLSDEDGPVAKFSDDLQAMGRSKLFLSLLGKLIAYKEVNLEA